MSYYCLGNCLRSHLINNSYLALEQHLLLFNHMFLFINRKHTYIHYISNNDGTDMNKFRMAIVYIQRYIHVINVSDLRQVYGFLRILRFHPPRKLTATIKLKSVESGNNHHKS